MYRVERDGELLLHLAVADLAGFRYRSLSSATIGGRSSLNTIVELEDGVALDGAGDVCADPLRDP